MSFAWHLSNHTNKKTDIHSIILTILKIDKIKRTLFLWSITCTGGVGRTWTHQCLQVQLRSPWGWEIPTSEKQFWDAVWKEIVKKSGCDWARGFSISERLGKLSTKSLYYDPELGSLDWESASERTDHWK